MKNKAQFAVIAIAAALLMLMMIYAGILQGKLVLPERPGSSHRTDRETTVPEDTTPDIEDETESGETEVPTAHQNETQPPRNPDQGTSGNNPTTPPTTEPVKTTPPTTPPTVPPEKNPPVTDPPETKPDETVPQETQPTEPVEFETREDEFPIIPVG